jgi:hypothetical protein
LSSNGSVAAVEDVDKRDWPNWTVMEGNQNSFPLIRVQEPLFEIPSELWEKLGYKKGQRRRQLPPQSSRISALSEVPAPEHRFLWSTKSRTLWKRLREQKATELLSCARLGKPALDCVEALADRFITASQAPESFVRQIAEAALSAMRQGSLTPDAVELLLVGKGPSDPNGKRPGAAVQLAMDLADPDQFPQAVYGRQTRAAVVEHLPPTPMYQRATGDERQGVDALTGGLAELEEKTLPKVDLPVPSLRESGRVGRKPFPLTSMFSEARCNQRYKLTDASVFPVAKQVGVKLKEALESATADERREQVWQFVASGRFESHEGRKIEKQDLLIVFVEECPSIDLKTASFFARTDLYEKQFEVDAQAVCAGLRAVVKKPPKSRLSLFLIRQVSKGQAQVVLAESPTVQQVLDAAERWIRAAKENLPQISLFLPEETRKDARSQMRTLGAMTGRPAPPYPDQAVRLLSYQWVRDGSSPKGPTGKPQKPNHEVVGPGLAEVLTLMLRVEGKWEPVARQMLGLLSQRLTPLLVGVFGAKHAYGPRIEQRRPEPLWDYPRSSRELALRSVAVLAILLDGLGHRKEQYMHNAPYQVGQVLALADTLHKDYCVVVRKGQLPTSLIGTALMRRAIENPAGAIADLGERMMEYVRWAKTVDLPSGDDKEQQRIAVYEARKKLRQFQPLSTALAAADLPTHTDDVTKALLLLGFLASPPDNAENGKDMT